MMTDTRGEHLGHHRRYTLVALIGQILANTARAGLLLGFGFWLLLASNMGSAYLPNVLNGSLDMGIRFALLGIAAMIWFVTPLWWLRFCYQSHLSYQRHRCQQKGRMP